MKRKTAHQELVQEADVWVTAIVVHRQATPCLRAGFYPPSCGGPIQGAHILRKGRTYISIRHHLDNVIGLCRNHHMYWAHTNELDFYEWIEELFPGRIAMLRETARAPKRKVDLKELICVLKSIHASEIRSAPVGVPASHGTQPETRMARESDRGTPPAA